MRTIKISGVFILFALLAAGFSTASLPAASQEGGQPEGSYVVGEGYDFATRVLSDSWDMKQFTDISQWLNHTTVASYDMTNIQVYDGVFSAHTIGTYSEFFPLFPGYEPGMVSGKIGASYPISSSRYQCFNMAMYSSWPSADYNYFILTWGPDRIISHLVNSSYIWGQSVGNIITRNTWQLYQINLTNPPYSAGEPWLYLSQWQLFRVAPSLQADTQFYVDWIRLTDCTPVLVKLTGLPQGTYNLWVGHGTTERQILVKGSFSPIGDGSYDWDVQGIEPDTYTYYVKTLDGGLIQQGTVTIDGTPIAGFTHPAPYTGTDYGFSNGNAWDIDPTDIDQVLCATPSISNGMLVLDTLPPSLLPDDCVGPGADESDPRVFMNTPDHGNMSMYRYLSFNVSQNGTLSSPEKGMIVRLVWNLERPGTDCWYVSKGIALEVGRYTYTADLHNAINGMPDEATPSDCPLVSWLNQASVGPLITFRMDPNENITLYTFHQEFDWMRLTQVEAIQQGQPSELRVVLDTPVEELAFLEFYYTTDLTQPNQHRANRYSSSPLSGPFLQFLPLALRMPLAVALDPFLATLPADVTFWWDTADVSLGIYYICALIGDTHTSAAYCSQAPIQIVAP